MTDTRPCEGLTGVDLERLLHIDDPDDWGGGLRLCADGVYRRDHADDGGRTAWRLLSMRERAAIGEPGECLLSLPCTLTQLEAFVDAELFDPNVARRLRLLRVISRSLGERRTPSEAGGSEAGRRTSISHRLSRDLLTPAIESAQRAVADRFDAAAVMGELERRARLPDGDGPAPLVRATSGGVLWLDGGTTKVLTRKALGDRLRRAKKREDALRLAKPR